LITVAMDSIGYGLIIPVMPELLKELANAGAAEAARWGGFLAFTYAAMNFLASPTLGGLSDRFGRRPVLLISVAMLSVEFAIMGLAQSLAVLFIGRLLTGISGATLPTANAFIADVTEPEHRAKAFGLVGASFGIGFVIGPALGGLIGGIDPRLPFFAAAGIAGLNMLYGLLVLPETLPKTERRRMDWKRANPFGAVRHFRKLPAIWWLLIAVLFYSFAHMVYPATWSYHGDARYGWGAAEIGASLMVVGLGHALVQVVVIRIALARLGSVKTAIFGVSCNIVAFVGYAFSAEGWMVFVWIPISALGTVGGPAINALVSERVSRSSQGELQGALASVQALSSMFSPPVMTQVFAFFAAAQYHFYGAAFLLAALLTSLSLVPFSLGVRQMSAPLGGGEEG
jgi:DHA1 family tetracycline resistance protein-like MFS transporter